MTEQRKGEIFVLLAGFFWAFFPIVATLAIKNLSGLVAFAWSSLFSMIFFAAVVTYRGRWQQARNTQLWKYAAIVAIFLGILFYALYYVALGYTTAGNAAIIAQLEMLASLVLFHVIRRDPFPLEYVIGSGLMLIGAVIILAPNLSSVNVGDLLMVVAALCTPIGNLYQQKARAIASSEVVMFLRTLMATPAVFLLVLLLHQQVAPSSLTAALPYLLVSGVILLGLSKLFWVEAIHRVPVTKGLAMQSIVPLLTLLFAWPLLSQTPTTWQLTSLVPFVLGILLLTDNLKFSRAKS